VTGFSEPTYPTPLRRLPELSHADAELWLKDDGKTHPEYGGNKVRKANALVRDAEARGARRLLTFGAAGSHHVLTLALFARARGLACAAMLTPQPRSEHAVHTLCAGLGVGLEAFPAPTGLAAPAALAQAMRAGDVVIPPGGSNALAASEYAAAVAELVGQLEELGEPPPDYLAVPLGTGGTTAGLYAGVCSLRLPTTVLGVSILANPFSQLIVEQLAGAVLSLRGRDATELDTTRLRIAPDFIGQGYGFATREGELATERLAASGLELDQTYTAKSMACVLDLIDRLRNTRRTRPLRIVHWHTLSSVPLAPLLEGAPAWDDLPPGLRRLFL